MCTQSLKLENDKTAMTTAINEVCIGCYLVSEIFRLQKTSNAFAAGQGSPTIDRVFHKGLGKGQVSHT